MEIRAIRLNDIPACAEILCSVYNNELWQCRWSEDVAAIYLADFFYMNKFVGYVLEDNEEIFGDIPKGIYALFLPINGVGNNKFAPKNITSEEEANGYANATREQALIIAVRMVENLKK